MRTRHVSRLWILATLVAALAIWGCSTAPTAPSVGADQKGVASSSLLPADLGDLDGTTTSLLSSTSLLVSRTINGALGGVIPAGDWKVVVPAGAFSGTAVITVKVPDASVRKVDLSISPPSLNSFQIPVALWCRFDSVVEAQSNDIYWWDPAAKTWRVVASTALLQSRVALLPHFSTYSGGRAGW